MKFLHISDIHLGCDRYNIKDAEKDFFDAFASVLEKYAIGEKVDFVLIAGDFFHKAQVQPQTMNYAVAALRRLNKEQIPIVVVEGNHDKASPNQKFSWLQALANWKYIYFLQPEIQVSESGDVAVVYKAWDEQKCRGGYIDIGRARIFGSAWWGASTNPTVDLVVEAIRKNLRDDAFHILLLHIDICEIEYVKNSATSLTRERLNKLKEVIDYLALGHVHMSYELEGWIFNPGSLEATNIEEAQAVRGAWLIEVSDENKIVSKRLVQDYKKREFIRLEFKVSDCKTPDEIYEGVASFLETKAQEGCSFKDKIVELSLTGILQFSRSSLDTKKIKAIVENQTEAYHVRLTNKVITENLNEINTEELTNKEIERRIIRSMVVRDSRYKQSEELVEKMTDVIINAKEMAVNRYSAEEIFNNIRATLLNE